MAQGYDLHTHTILSDGLLTPRQNVELASSVGLQGIAITDHDTVLGVEEALAAGSELGIDVVPGVEISTSANGEDIHVLGLWVDWRDETFLARLSSNQDVRRERNKRMIQALRDLGFDVSLEEAERIAAERRNNGDRTVSRPHIAELLVQKGYVTTVQEAFDVYLGDEGKAYVNVERISPEEAAVWIHEAGGVAVLAHPGLYRDAEPLIEQLSPYLDAIEVSHADHSAADEKRFREIAERFGLQASAGSDFHGMRDGIPYHAMLGSRAAGQDAVHHLKKLRVRRSP